MEEYRERLSGTVELTHLSGATATTTDALLLAAFLPHCRERSLELGAGCGIVTILAAARGRLSHGELCERDMTLAALCEKNLKNREIVRKPEHKRDNFKKSKTNKIKILSRY